MGYLRSPIMKKKFVSCCDIGEVPRSPGKWNWNWLYFLPFIFTFEQGEFKVINSAKIENANYTKECFLICSFISFSNEFLTGIFPQYLRYKSLFYT